MTELQSRLLFALRPSVPAAEEMARVAVAAARSGRHVARERLHVTLALLGDFASLPERLVERACDAIAGRAPTACRVVVDLLVSGTRSMLLMPSEPVVGLVRLHASLIASLARAGIAPPPSRFAPHVTLGYDAPSGPTRAIDPIGWRAEELLLVHSHLGRTRHDVVGRWPLAIDA